MRYRYSYPTQNPNMKIERNLANPTHAEKRLKKTTLKAVERLTIAIQRRYFFPREAKRLQEELGSPKSLLDIGSGRGYLGDALQAAMPDTQVICTDVGTDHKGQTPFVTASADALPFADQRFDASTIFYVLHHMDRPEDALREAKRVSKKIVVHEDVYKNRLQKKWFEMHVKSSQLNFPKAGAAVKTDKEWTELFKSEGLEIKKKRRVRKFGGYPIKRFEYILEPKTVFSRE